MTPELTLPDSQKFRYIGQKGPLFWLLVRTGLLTLLTLGIYRFWQKTRTRKYIWSSVSVDGDTFEYTGTGLEKCLGFLLAIVFLAVYLGILQMILFYFGLNIMVDPDTATQAEVIAQMAAIYVSFLAVVPFMLFAVYRSRRYKMARTRFRGIRLGMEKGAWGYVLRALGYGVLATITLGILTPLMTFRLEKYMADRSFFGGTPLRQEGRWTALYQAMKQVFVAIAILVVSGLVMMASPVLGGIGLFVGWIWLLFGLVSYRVQSFGYLMRHKVLGPGTGAAEVRFDAAPRTGEVIKFYILGSLLLGILSSVVFGIVFALASPFLMGLTEAMRMGEPSSGQGSMAAPVAGAVVIGIGYLVGLVIVQALSVILITQPILAHYIDTITLKNPAGLDHVTQRAALTGIDADGFADALDIGGAI